MSARTSAYTIFIADPETGTQGSTIIATVTPATDAEIEMVLEAPVWGDDGRSPFQWITLQNGDMILGVFPHGETFEKVRQKVNGRS